MEGIFTIKDKSNFADFFLLSYFLSIEVFLKGKKTEKEVMWMFIF